VKVSVFVRLKEEVLDPQGDAVKRALMTLGFEGVQGVRIGKLIELEVEGQHDATALKARVAKMADELLANPVIEDYEVRVE
jgi:phosphoribosylformylglycinamidine synthase subunit PurS